MLRELVKWSVMNFELFVDVNTRANSQTAQSAQISARYQSITTTPIETRRWIAYQLKVIKNK